MPIKLVGETSGSVTISAPITGDNKTVYLGEDSFLATRQVITTVFEAVPSYNSADGFIDTGCDAFQIISVNPSSECWLVFYANTESRTLDAQRDVHTDPASGSGVLLEVSGGANMVITPSCFGFNTDGSKQMPVKIFNNTGSSASINVDVTILKLEE